VAELMEEHQDAEDDAEGHAGSQQVRERLNHNDSLSRVI
jgi:hypothetical protein